MAVKLTGGMAIPNDTPEKVFALIHAFPGRGKTGLGFTFPEPFWMFNLDRSIGQFMKGMPSTHHLEYEGFMPDVDSTSKNIAQGYLLKFDALVKSAVSANVPGTFFLDGSDMFWDLVKVVKVPEGDEDKPKAYEEANSYMNNHLRRLGLSKLNVVFTTPSSKVWTGMKQESDRVKPDGFKHMARWLTHEMYLYSPEDFDTPDVLPMPASHPGQNHMAYITKSKLKESLIGTVIPNITYAMLYKLTFGSAYPEPGKLWVPWAKPVAPTAVAEGAA